MSIAASKVFIGRCECGAEVILRGQRAVEPQVCGPFRAGSMPCPLCRGGSFRLEPVSENQLRALGGSL